MSEKLHVQKIREGTVIDHISAGCALSVLRILGITGREGNVVSIIMNVPSQRLGTKDIVKVEGRELEHFEVDKIAMIAPKATINIIRDYLVVEKQKTKLPRIIRGIARCGNVTCVSNSDEPVEAVFFVECEDPVRLRCYYCNRFMEQENVLGQF